MYYWLQYLASKLSLRQEGRNNLPDVTQLEGTGASILIQVFWKQKPKYFPIFTIKTFKYKTV